MYIKLYVIGIYLNSSYLLTWKHQGVEYNTRHTFHYVLIRLKENIILSSHAVKNLEVYYMNLWRLLMIQGLLNLGFNILIHGAICTLLCRGRNFPQSCKTNDTCHILTPSSIVKRKISIGVFPSIYFNLNVV